MSIANKLFTLFLWSTCVITWYCSLSIKYINTDKFLSNITSDTQLYYKSFNDQTIICYSTGKYWFENTYNCAFNDDKLHNNISDTIPLHTSYLLNIINYICYVYLWYTALNLTFFLLRIFMYGFHTHNHSTDKEGNSKSVFSSLFLGDEPLFTVNKYEDINVSNEFIGCANVKKEIDKLINFLTNKLLYTSNDCQLSRGLILLGPPGTGKTHIVRQICKMSRYNYISTSGSDFVNKYVGTGAANVRKLFNLASANSPTIIFIDEADSIISKRNYSDSSGGTSEHNNTICKILELMDSLNTNDNTFVIFASNMPENKIDTAIKRSGRAEMMIKLDYPTNEERKDLFKLYLKEYYTNQIDLERVSKESYGLTGADIKKIINNIHINKVNKHITSNDHKFHNLVSMLESMIFKNISPKTSNNVKPVDNIVVEGDSASAFIKNRISNTNNKLDHAESNDKMSQLESDTKDVNIVSNDEMPALELNNPDFETSNIIALESKAKNNSTEITDEQREIFNNEIREPLPTMNVKYEIPTYNENVNFNEMINLDNQPEIDPLNDRSVYSNMFTKTIPQTNQLDKIILEQQAKILEYNSLPFYKRWFTKSPTTEIPIETLIPPPPKILKTITTQDILDQITLHILGMERNKQLNIQNKNIIAYHEAGHALMAFILKDGEIPTKICISVVSDALGYTMHIPDEDDLLLRGTSKKQIARLLVLYAGRLAETYYLGDQYTSGGSNDYQKAKEILKNMVLTGLLNPSHNYIDHMKEYEPTILNKELETIVLKMNKLLIKQAQELLELYKDELKKIAELIIEKTSINDDDIKQIYNKGQYFDVSDLKNEMTLLLE